ncbi:bifunctional 5,10-methylenetetrahydrofolate dehydrogenase/5,10-methenyltetrahydrofolate cyclohydrolase [Lachnospiraceae bacterium 62-35]
MITLKGIDTAGKIKEEIDKGLEELKGYIPCLAIIRVGERPDDVSYEKGAVKKMEKLGLKALSYVFPEKISDEKFKEEFCRINGDDKVDGILLLKPLPRHICEKDIEKLISPEKDLDGISPENIAKVFAGDKSGFAPCTAEAVMEVLKAEKIETEGKRMTIVGRSMVVGRPLSMLALGQNATVTVCHTKTKNLKEECQRAEILVAAAGKAGMIDKSYVGENAVVIDVGINVDENGKLCGDVDFEGIKEKAAMATPVPGGVGMVTTSVLAKHLVQAVLAKKS